MIKMNFEKIYKQTLKEEHTFDKLVSNKTPDNLRKIIEKFANDLEEAGYKIKCTGGPGNIGMPFFHPGYNASWLEAHFKIFYSEN